MGLFQLANHGSQTTIFFINQAEAAIMQAAKEDRQMARWVAICVYELKEHQIVVRKVKMAVSRRRRDSKTLIEWSANPYVVHKLNGQYVRWHSSVCAPQAARK